MEINRTKVDARFFFLNKVKNATDCFEFWTWNIHDSRYDWQKQKFITFSIIHMVNLCIMDGFCIQNGCVWCDALIIIIPKTIFWLWICMKCSPKKNTHKNIDKTEAIHKKIKVFFSAFGLLALNVGPIFEWFNFWVPEFFLIVVKSCHNAWLQYFIPFWIIQNLEN